MTPPLDASPAFSPDPSARAARLPAIEFDDARVIGQRRQHGIDRSLPHPLCPGADSDVAQIGLKPVRLLRRRRPTGHQRQDERQSRLRNTHTPPPARPAFWHSPADR